MLSEKITLVVLAAGLGSRFGGAKQLTPIEGLNKTIMELNIFDAYTAGITDVVLVVNQDIKQQVEREILPRLPTEITVELAIQNINDVPAKYHAIAGKRTKPWGTGHALLAAKSFVTNKAIVITADDYYGASAYQTLVTSLLDPQTHQHWCLVGYPILQTLSQQGGVNRGICRVDEHNHLQQVTEFLDIRYQDDRLSGLNSDHTRVEIAGTSLVSMTIWGVDNRLFSQLESGFNQFLEQDDSAVEREYYLPDQIQKTIDNTQQKIIVKQSKDLWLGMTYRSELQNVSERLKQIFKGSSIDSCQSNQ